MKQLVLLVLNLLILCSCAGPTSPFGSNIFITNEYSVVNDRKPQSAALKNIKVESSPANKIYHTPFTLKIKVANNNDIISNFHYEIIYNGQKLERWWETESISFNPSKTVATIEFKNIFLRPGLKNNIDFHFYLNKNSKPYIYSFAGPQCNLEYQENITQMDQFKKHTMYLPVINTMALKYNINPYLLAGLVAQESSFNPKAVSWAKALGLTQVTPLANIDIISKKKDWKYYPNIQKTSYPILKYKIYKGIINASNDWRLDKSKSLEGGTLYIEQLLNYWSLSNNQKLLEKTFTDIPLTDILLASYNSGPTRVKNNIKKMQKDWLWSTELNEARKYVMNIKSYCHQFKNKR